MHDNEKTFAWLVITPRKTFLRKYSVLRLQLASLFPAETEFGGIRPGGAVSLREQGPRHQRVDVLRRLGAVSEPRWEESGPALKPRGYAYRVIVFQALLVASKT